MFLRLNLKQVIRSKPSLFSSDALIDNGLQICQRSVNIAYQMFNKKKKTSYDRLRSPALSSDPKFSKKMMGRDENCLDYSNANLWKSLPWCLICNQDQTQTVD